MWSGFSIALVASVLAGDALAAAVGAGSESHRTYHHHRRSCSNPSPYYVIIGGGPSGYVLAEELSRDPSKSVILLEAGPDTAGVKYVDTPFFGPLLLQTQYTFNFTSQPDPNINNNAPYLHQGRGTGGGSAINYMGYCRGAPSVYDQWAQISGNPAFQFNNFINAYKATAHYTPTQLNYNPMVDQAAYGNGPVELTAPDDDLGFVLRLFKAWQNVLKLPQVDLNDGHGIGAATGVDSIRASNRTRSYAPQAYGWQMAGRKNVQVLVNSMATKIGFNGIQAVNVTYVDGSGNSHTLCPREVIVSAGAINSPKLLLLSGVGPASDLQELNIPVVANIPQVGQNLLDHHFSFFMYQVTNDVDTIPKYFSNSTFMAEANAQYAQGGQGPLGVPPGDAFAIERAPNSIFTAVGDNYHPNLPADRGQLLFQYAAAPLQQSPPPPNVNIISPFVALTQPQASGSLKLASANYMDNPIINSNYYGSPGDKAAILYGYKQIRQIIADSNIAPKIVKEIFPGANVTSDADLWTAISTSAGTFHHPMGTNAMGTVVDGNTFRVKGLQGIRVVDSSIFPVMPDCHIMAETYATAWLAAQAIRAQDH